MAVFGITTVTALITVPWYGLENGYSGGLWIGFIALMIWNGLSITAGYHRLFAHKSYDAHPIVRLLFALGGALAVQNSIKTWCSNHRNHHRYVDDNQGDPYCARKGLWFSHIGWMLADYPASAVTEGNVKDLMEDPIVRFQDKHYWSLAFSLNVLLTLVLGWMLGDAIGGLLLMGFLRLVLCHHTTFLINSLAHAWGSQPYSDENTARDNPVIALLTYGEGYHNFHHAFQWDYRNGLRWYQFDPTKWLIRTLSLIGLAGNLKRVAPEKIEKSIASMQLKRATNGLLARRRNDAEEWIAQLEKEYNELVDSINAWAACRQEWLETKRASLAQKWDVNEMRLKLRSMEASLELQRYRWQMLTAQFA